MAGRIDRCDKLIAVMTATLGKIAVAGEFQADT